MCSILQSCIEEASNLDEELIDTLLDPLLPSKKEDNPSAYKMVGTVLRRTISSVQTPLSEFVNNILVGTLSAGPGKEIESDLSEHIYLLINELYKISPQLLVNVLPNVCVQLKADEEAVRLKAVKLLGQLFSNSRMDIGDQFSRDFKDFLGRFADISAVIRLEMVEQGSLLMSRKKILIPRIEGTCF